MKKRLLSMLLLAVMLVTAIPFAIFVSAAGDTAEEEPYDYNALYVDENLILAFDIMASNGFGGAALDAMPQSPMTMTEYEYGGTSHDFTNIEERYDYSARYFVIKENSDGNTLGNYASGAHTTLAAAEAACATAQAADSKNTYSVVGPYNYLILRTNKDGVAPIVMLESVYNSIGFTDRTAAENAVYTLEEKDTSDIYNYYVIGTDTTAAYQAAGKAYHTAINAWLAKYVWRTGSVTMTASDAPSNHTNAYRRLRDSMGVYAPWEEPAEGQGYLVRKYPYCSDWGIQINKLPEVDALSGQMIIASEKLESSFMIFANVRPTLSGTKDQIVGTNNFFVPVADSVVSNAFDTSVATSMTFTLTGGMTLNGDATDCDRFSIVTPDTTLYSADGIYTHTVTKKEDDVEVVKPALHGTNIIGYTNSAPNAKIYALRYYDKALTEADILQNHFADIAKWYHLDMALYETLNAEQKAAARAEIVAFVAADAALNFSADSLAGSTIQTKLDNFALDTIYGQLTDAPDEFKTVAKNVRADISGVLALPVEYRQSIYDVVLNMLPEAQKVGALVQANITAELDRVLNLYYGMYMNTTTMTYKDIYVHKDNLVVWLDFFAAKASDGNLYDDHSYTDKLTPWDPEKYGNITYSLPQLDLDANGNVQYNDDGTPKYIDGARNVSRRAVKGDLIPNWHLPSTIKVNNVNTPNPDKIKVPETSNMAEAYEKYVFKGGNQTTKNEGFKFYDLPDTGYGHTNIRQYGDGCLIGGLNNSLKVYSPGRDVETVTYQFVTNIKGNLQLDGYRAATVLNDKGFYIDNINYYGYGVATDGYTLSESSLQTFRPNKTVPAGTAMDLTVTLDKKLGQDTGHYYTEVYATNNEGAIKYRDDAAQKDLFRYTAEGTNYLCQVDGDVYTALYTVNAVGNKFYIAHDEKPVKSVRLVKGADGSFTVDWTSAVYEAVTEDTVLAARADHVFGPYYKNPFPEVDSETPGATGPIVYKGTYDLGVYANGSEYLYLSGLPYTSSDIGSVGNSGNLTTYAIRTYNIVLTEEEIRQNHFADLAGFYGLDLAPYALLNAEQKSDLHKRLCSLQLGLSKAEGKRVYQEAIDAVFYNFDETIEGAEHFLAICHAFGLNTSSLNQLSPEAQARVFAKFADVDAGARNYTAILQKNLEDAVAAEIEDRYAAAFSHNAITFNGWQLKDYGTYGMRAVFSTDQHKVADLEAHGATVKTGLLMAEKGGSINSLDALKLSFADGELVVPDGVTLVQGYWDGALNADATFDGNTLTFNKEVVFDDLAEAEDEDIADALRDREYYYIGFSVVEYTDKESGTETCSIFYENATLGGKAGAFSIYDITEVAKYDYKLASKNIQTTMNLCEEEGYISASVGTTGLESYLLVRSAETAHLDAVQAAVESALGFQLNMVRGAEVVAGEGGYLHIGVYDNPHPLECYGISTYGDNIYIWANSDAKIEDAIALFTDYLELQLANGMDAFFEADAEIVCRAR